MSDVGEDLVRFFHGDRGVNRMKEKQKQSAKKAQREAKADAILCYMGLFLVAVVVACLAVAAVLGVFWLGDVIT